MANIVQKVAMSSKFIEHSPEADTEKSLILIMDKDGNVTADPDHFEKIMSTKQIPEMGIKIVRMDANQAESENEEENGEKAELKLTVEEIYPENVALGGNESSSNLINSTMESLPGNSGENMGHDIVEPFLDQEQLECLANALASDQAKQILGENVAAMLDMLNVDDSPAALLQKSITNDHDYTPLLPSADPNGPGYHGGSGGPTRIRIGNRMRIGPPLKARKLIAATTTVTAPKKPQVKQVQSPVKAQPAKIPEVVTIKSPKAEENDPNFEEDVDIEDMDSEGSVDVEDDNYSDEDYNDRTKKTKRRPKRSKKRLAGRKLNPARVSSGRPIPKPGARLSRRSSNFEEIRARNEKLNDEMAKVVQSLEFSPKSEEDKTDLKKSDKLKTYKKKKSVEGQSESESEKMKEAKPTEEQSQQQKPTATPKYPKRENRKPPAHLAEAFGPALFSAPDIIRRISTTDEVPQTPPEKKNFTVGALKISPTTPTESKPPALSKSTEDLSKPMKAAQPKPEPDRMKSPVTPISEVKIPDIAEEKPKEEIAISSERAVIIKNENPEVPVPTAVETPQTNPPKPAVYEEDQDYSDENIEENYYLDPTQMDQSLLAGFGQSEIKNEEQLLQEAILLQEQLLGSQDNAKNMDPPPAVPIQNPKEIETSLESYSGIITPIGDNPPETLMETGAVDNTQNELASTVVSNPQEKAIGDENPKGISKKSEETPVKKTNNSPKKINMNRPSGETESQFEEVQEDGKLVVDENRPEERKRHSAKRRRSDEVSDLDSDLDDALSEASWNSEDDPDRLWCICRKPHNNRFMICCDNCEEWFHGKCVGITKTIGKQMEQDGQEWSCPNCTKKKKEEGADKESEKIKLLKEKMAQSIKEQQLKNKELQKSRNPNPGGRDRAKLIKSNPLDLKQTKISDFHQKQSKSEEGGGRKCIMCKGPCRENSIYCSDDCITKHSQQTISQILSNDATKKTSPTSSGQTENVRIIQRVKKDDGRITVMDMNTKKILTGPQAPTAANLATFLKENPSYRVVNKKTESKLVRLVQIRTKSGQIVQKLMPISTAKGIQQGDATKSTQLKLAVSPNSKQLKILPSAGGKKIIQIVNAPSVSGLQKSGPIVIKQKQAEIIEALPMPIKSIPTKTVQVRSKLVEVPAPKTPTTPVAKESPVLKTDNKIQKKRKEKVSKVAATSTTAKDSRLSLSKQDEGRDKDKDKNAEQLVRESVKKTLAETLKLRVQDCKEIEYNEEHINNLAIKIEEKLYKHFENKTDAKYKSKYRSLVFNIKDPKNETLFRKIADNSISPKELVKLSPEELASQELAKWREKEQQHQLEMIKKTELEAMTIGNTYIMKSHKGEEVIASQSEKASVAAEIDPNVPAQELVSILNSVSSTTQDAAEDEDKKEDLETSLMKMKKKEKESRRSKDRKHGKRDRRRSRSRSRSRRSKEKKRSRSRSKSKDKDRDRSKHRHKDKSKEKEKEKEKEKSKKKEKDVKEELEEKVEVKPEKSEISTTEIFEEEVPAKKYPETFDDADHEPSSTVIIKTPDINVEEQEAPPLWKGLIAMADVAKFKGIASEISGDCTGLAGDLGEKVDVVGRIPYDTVWDYITRMKKMATKDILVIKILPKSEEEKISYTTLFHYLSKRSRIGVIGKTSDCIKDFYLYPLASHSPIPQVLLPLEGLGLEDDREHIILGIIVRNKQRSRHQRALSTDHTTPLTPKTVKKLPTVTEELPIPESGAPDRSYTPPLPDKEISKKDPRIKRKIRVQIDYNKPAAEDDDSPYSPGDSDEDLPPLPKISKPTVSPSIPTSLSKLLSPVLPTADSLPQDPAEIQRKIEEMNRAIEEQAKQIQNLTSTVPELAAELPSIPLLGTETSSILSTTSSLLSHSTPLASIIPSAEKIDPTVPLISTPDEDERYSPSRSFTPPPKTEESIPLLSEVTSKISLPSNLQEILNSIQKKSDSEDVLKCKDADSSADESKPLLSRMSDEDIIRKATEMEMEMKDAFPVAGLSYPPQPLPPGIGDLPLGPITYPPPSLFMNPPPPEDEKQRDEKKPKTKLDPKTVFESEGVTDFLANPNPEEKKKKAKNFKIDIKLAINSLENKPIDSDHFDIESISTSDIDERQLPSSSLAAEAKHDIDERRRGGSHDRRRSEDRKQDPGRRRWDEPKRYDTDYRRFGGGRRDRPKFRPDRFHTKRAEREWDGDIRDFEERQRRRNQEIRKEELKRLRNRVDSDEEESEKKKKL